MLDNQQSNSYYQKLVKEHTFIEQFNLLLKQTNNLQIQETQQKQLVASGTKLNHALLLERTFLLNLLKALINPVVPLKHLLNVSRRSNSASVIR